MNWYYTYLIIFIIKSIGGTLSNYRLILMSEDNKIGAFIMNFFSTITWIVSVSMVFNGISKDPFIAIPFVSGILVGNYIGMFLDQYIKAGKILTTVITDNNNLSIIEEIKNEGFHISSLKAEGKDGNKKVLLISSNRKRHSKLLDIISHSNTSFTIAEKAEKII